MDVAVIAVILAVVFGVGAWGGVKLSRLSSGPPRGGRRVRTDGSFGFITWAMGDSGKSERDAEGEDRD